MKEECNLGISRHKLSAYCIGLVQIARHLLRRLSQSPALIVYLVSGTAVAFAQNGFLGLCLTLANLAILGAFAVLIREMTADGVTEPLPVRRPKAELFAGLSVFLLIIFLVFLGWNLMPIPLLQSGMERFIAYGYKLSSALCGNGPLRWAREPLGNSFITVCIELVPTLLLFLAFGYGPRGMGFRLRYGRLTLILLTLTALTGLFNIKGTTLYHEYLPQTLVLFIIQMFINGLPEELLFRGFLLSRLELALKNPVNALILSSLLFNACHIPSNLANGESWLFSILNVFSLICPTGLLYGYLYQRTRSIVPGVLFHTASTNILGWFFFSL